MVGRTNGRGRQKVSSVLVHRLGVDDDTGQCNQLKVTRHMKFKNQNVGGPRGNCAEYNASVRKRHIEAIHKIPERWQYRCSFLTLTYPGWRGWREEYADCELVIIHIKRWWARVEKQYPSAWML